jgi:predicted Zn-dependent peptidase
MIAVAVSVLATSPAGADGAPAEPAVTRTTLANGLRVILAEDHHAPLVAVHLGYQVGAADDPRHEAGLAHLVEHLMFEGSKHVPEDAVFRLLERAGATLINGQTCADNTTYYEVLPRGRLELALWFESDRMGFLLDRLDAAALAKQREILRDEWVEHSNFNLGGRMHAFTLDAIYPEGHPYHRPPGEALDALDRITLEDARRFYAKWYAPDNATLVISGDIDPSPALALVEKYFGPIPAAGVPPRPVLPAPVLHGETRLKIGAPLDAPRIEIAWPTPAYFAPGDAELDLLAQVLAGSAAARLPSRLTGRDPVAAGVTARQLSARLGSTFVIVVEGKPHVPVADVMKVIDEEIERVKRDGVTPAELENAQRIYATGRARTREGGLSHASALDMLSLHSEDVLSADDAARYERATPDSLREASRRYLVPDRVVATAIPFPGAVQSGTLLEARTRTR